MYSMSHCHKACTIVRRDANGRFGSVSVLKPRFSVKTEPTAEPTDKTEPQNRSQNWIYYINNSFNNKAYYMLFYYLNTKITEKVEKFARKKKPIADVTWSYKCGKYIVNILYVWWRFTAYIMMMNNRKKII